MKVRLLGINPQVYNEPANDSYICLLKELTFPIETESYSATLAFDDDWRELVNLEISPKEDEWEINWFIYEEIKEA